MSSLFPDLRNELVGAMERRPQRDRRRPAALVIAVAMIAAVAVFAMTARPTAPRERPATTPAPSLPPAIDHEIRRTLIPGTTVPQLRVADPTGLAWDTAMWAGTDGTVSLTEAAAGALQSRGADGWGVFVIARNLSVAPLVGLHFAAGTSGGRPHYVVVGMVESRAAAVTVTLAGQRREATMSHVLLSRRVVVPRAVKANADAGLPGEVTLKLFAVAFSPPHSPATTTLRPTIAVTLPDGTTSTQDGPRYCISRRCGRPPTPLR